jgi:hypothetical protein
MYFKYPRIYLKRYVYNEALKQDDGVLEFLLENHTPQWYWCDFDLTGVKHIPLLEKLVGHFHTENLLEDACTCNRADILEYFLKQGVPDWFDWDKKITLCCRDMFIDPLLVVMKYAPLSVIKRKGVFIIAHFSDDKTEKTHQMIRGLCYKLNFVPSKGKKIVDMYRERTLMLLGEVCMRKNIPLCIQLNIYQFIKY